MTCLQWEAAKGEYGLKLMQQTHIFELQKQRLELEKS
jgi:hypothetical protein